MKSASYGPREIFFPLPDVVKVHCPLSKGNSNVNERETPGPSEVIPSFGDTFWPSLVVILIFNPPIGIAASFVKLTITKRTSSSSSSISIFTSVSLASREAARWLCWSLISLTLKSTKEGGTSRACRISLLIQ